MSPFTRRYEEACWFDFEQIGFSDEWLFRWLLSHLAEKGWVTGDLNPSPTTGEAGFFKLTENGRLTLKNLLGDKAPTDDPNPTKGIVSEDRYLSILKRLNERQKELQPSDFHDINIPWQSICQNLDYLIRHGFAKGMVQKQMNQRYVFGGVEITETGIDYFEENGGLTAFQKQSTVKLDAESLRPLIEVIIQRTKDSEGEKSVLLKVLKNAPDALMGKVTDVLLSKGLELAGPEVIELLKQAKHLVLGNL